MVLVLVHSAIAFEPDWQTPEARCAALTAWHGHCATDELHACHPRRILSFLIACWPSPSLLFTYLLEIDEVIVHHE